MSYATDAADLHQAASPPANSTGDPHHAPPNVSPASDDEVVTLHRRSQEETDIDITPMIDCVFLLLIFFIVTSKIDSKAQVPLPAARYGEVVSNREGVVVTIAPGTLEAPKIYLADGVQDSALIASTDIEGIEAQIGEYVRSAVEGAEMKKHIIVKADGSLPTGQVDMVYRAIGAAGIESIEVIHVGIMEEN